MSERRFGLATIQAVATNEGLHAEFVENSDNVCLREYSEFKYGNGEVANKLGALLAERFLTVANQDEGDFLVTSSAYKSAPPAARALQDSFVRNIGIMHGNQTRVSTFKIHRSNLTDGDYAAMSLMQRQEVMAANGLILPEDLEVEGQNIVILDDISVTGSHEELLRNLFVPLSPASMHYGYVLSVLNGKSFPGIEAAINATSIHSLGDVIALTQSPLFTPNARFCKFILGQTVDEIEQFTQVAAPALLEVMSRYVQEDGLEEISSYRVKARYFIKFCQQPDLQQV